MNYSSLHILLIEDNPADAEFLRQLLKEEMCMTWRIAHVMRLAEALNYIQCQSVDLVLTDLSLPDAQGLDTVTQVHNLSAVPIVVLTGCDDEDVGLAALRQGAEDYLVKGQINYSLLIRTIRHAMERSRAQQRIEQQDEEIRFLQSMTQAIFESEDFYSALGIALKRVGEATEWDFGEAWIPQQHENVVECSPVWYCSTPELAAFRQASETMTFAPGVGLPGRVWATRQPEWRRDVSDETSAVYLRAKAAKDVGLRSALGIPIIANDEVLAVLIFYMFESRDEDERLIRLISASTQLGLAIQRKRAEDDVRKALETERELNMLKNRFISMTSHEFRTSLSTISLSSELLAHHGDKLTDEKKAQHLQRIRTSVQHMTQLLDDVLFIGKDGAGKLEFNPIPLNLEMLCRDVLDDMQLKAGYHYLLSLTYQGECADLLLDEKLVRQILTNLLSNALKYSPDGGHIRIRLICQSAQTIIEVEDHGIGIPAKALQHLFETFYRANNVSNIPGTGLGLSIVKRCVDIHGGSIRIKSSLGHGSTFTVRLPKHPSPHGQTYTDPFGRDSC